MKENKMTLSYKLTEKEVKFVNAVVKTANGREKLSDYIDDNYSWFRPEEITPFFDGNDNVVAGLISALQKKRVLAEIDENGDLSLIENVFLELIAQNEDIN